MMRSLVNSTVLSSLVLTIGVLAGSANAQQPTPMVKINRQEVLPATQISTPIYIAQADTSIASLEQAVRDRVNQYRASRSLPALAIDTRISEQARIHSQNMATGKVPVSHDGVYQRLQTINRVIPLSAAGENVAYNYGYKNPANAAVEFWLKSTAHRQNIEGNFNLAGIGVAKDPRGYYYFTQIFIRSR